MIQMIKKDCFRRTEIFPETVEQKEITNAVRSILEDVKLRGDTAVKYYTKTFDHVEILDTLVENPIAIAKGG